MHRKPTKKSFIQRTRRTRKLALVGIKNSLRRYAPYFDGHFYTHDVLGTHTSWADIYFISRKNPHLFYNATIDTCAYFAKEQADQMAWDEAQSLYESTYPQHKGLFYEHAPGFKQKKNPEFDALFQPSLYQWLDACAQKFLDQQRVIVHEGAKIDRSYRFGIGLQLVVNAPHITPEYVLKSIEDFFAAGEVSYQADLSIVITSEQAAKVSSCNAVETDPSTWAMPFAQALESQKQAQHLEEQLHAAPAGTGSEKRL